MSQIDRDRIRGVVMLAVLVGTMGWFRPARGLQDTTATTAARKAPNPFWLPLGSVVVPGLGQYVRHDPVAGLGFTLSYAAGLGLSRNADVNTDRLPRQWSEQREQLGLSLAVTAGELSSYDTFRRLIRPSQEAGRFEFIATSPSVEQLFLAPFDLRYATRWTTLVGLVYTGVVAATVLNDVADPATPSLAANDVAYASVTSFGAGVGEEAMFRGWIYPVLNQAFGRHFVPADALQAATFAGLHTNAGWFRLAIASWAFYQGWLTRRNGWDVRESAFQHFWYDAAIFLASLSKENGQALVSVTLPLSVR